MTTELEPHKKCKTCKFWSQSNRVCPLTRSDRAAWDGCHSWDKKDGR